MSTTERDVWDTLIEIYESGVWLKEDAMQSNFEEKGEIEKILAEMIIPKELVEEMLTKSSDEVVNFDALKKMWY